MSIVASGKTTYAKGLSKQTGFPFIELDAVVYHNEDGVRIKRTPEEQVQIIREMDAKGSWIAEGVYRPSYHLLLEPIGSLLRNTGIEQGPINLAWFELL